ncbi:hypothetical protein F5Y10DRAFT_71159 [Nemania abortiva]|nr:hypothetical protein F5Y10DRAFT_71159 [Nemania abortiva]
MLVSKVDNMPDDKVIVGSPGNFWIWSPHGGWNLTRPTDPNSEPRKDSVYLDCELSNVILDPAITALVIVDMQNIAMSQALDVDTSPAMYTAEKQLIKYGIPAARALRFQVIWLNWGLVEDDITHLTPAEARVFGFKANSNKADYGLSERKGDPTDPDNFLRCGEHPVLTKIPGAELGEVVLEDGTRIDAGRAMMKGTWNAALHGPLAAAYEQGKKEPRPDVWINKNRNSGLWNATSECSEFLAKNGIRTLLFAGVNMSMRKILSPARNTHCTLKSAVLVSITIDMDLRTRRHAFK